MGEIVYCGEKIKSNALPKHNLADISEPLCSYVASKHFCARRWLLLFRNTLFLLFAYVCKIFFRFEKSYSEASG